jgi:NAD(P)-dependent dehydrogenase (short-subunit alcohol dehydrogenase family)
MFLSTPEDYRQQLVDRIPMGRLATADDVAAAVRFLAST